MGICDSGMVGTNDYIKRESDNISTELGNVNVLALDLYDGKVAATPDSAMKLVQAVKTERLENIIKGALGYAGPKAKFILSDGVLEACGVYKQLCLPANKP